MEKALCSENEQKYQLAHNTPIAKSPLVDNLGLNGLTEKAKMVTKGNYIPPPSIHKDHSDWLQQIEKTEEAKNDNNILPPITTKTFRQRWKKAKDKNRQ